MNVSERLFVAIGHHSWLWLMGTTIYKIPESSESGHPASTIARNI